MQRTFKFNTKFAFALISAFVLLLAMAFSCGINGIAFADQENIEVVFPSSDYIQTINPNLICANDKYLAVLDSDESILYIRADENYQYELTIDEINSIYLLEDTLFISCENKYYTLDLLDKESVAHEVTLASPLNIAYLSSDGTYLYAKSVAGFMSIYDSELNIAFEIDNMYADALAGKMVYVGSENYVYTFTTNYGYPFLNKFNFISEDTQEIAIDVIVQSAYLGSAFFAQINDKIVVLDKLTGEVLLETEISPDTYCAYDDNLFVVQDGVISIYSFNENELTLISSLSMSGSDLKHLDGPKDILMINDSLVVADYNNSRISVISNSGIMTEIKLDQKPFALTNNGTIIYALADEGFIYKIQNGLVTQTYKADGAKDLTYLDKLYILKDNGLYVLLGGNFVKFATLSDTMFVSSYKDSNNIYVLCKEGIKVIAKNGSIFNTNLDGNLVNAKDFKVDYAGNFIILFNDSLNYVINGIDCIYDDNSITIEDDNLSIHANAFCLDGEKAYLTTNECLIIKATFQTKTEANFVPNEYTITMLSDYDFATMADTLAYNSNGNVDTLYYANGGTVIILKDFNVGDELSLVYDGVNKLIVPSSALTTMTFESYSKNMVANTHTTLLSLPTIQDGTVEIEKDTKVKELYKVTFNEIDYSFVKYETGFFYCQSKDLDEDLTIIDDDDNDEPTPIEDKKATARIKAGRVGGKVNIYTSASTDSDVAFTLTDGKKVQLLEETESFYKVSYNGNEGYVLKTDLQLKGLTTVQIIAIVLSLIVLAAGATIFVAIYITKKKQLNK